MLQIDDMILHENSATLMPVADSLEEVEQVHILRVLQHTSWVMKGKKGTAIRLLAISEKDRKYFWPIG
ncbi:MAG: hypothetical protein OEV77_09420 [Nitrospira sp.]|nr:hypothetical protein [Nitrospira sp.]MDH4328731.1 hypothetical protein [Nitrospira sp.]